MKKRILIMIWVLGAMGLYGQQESIKVEGYNHTHYICGNGDFEWPGGGFLVRYTDIYGEYLGSSPTTTMPHSCTLSNGNIGTAAYHPNYCRETNIPTNNGTSAIIPSRISKQTVGTDPIVGIQRIPIYGGATSIRLGNATGNSEFEGITSGVFPSQGINQFKFWYATVLEYCSVNSISPIDQAGFRVYVYEVSGGSKVDITTSVLNLGNNSNTVRASSSDPFLTRYGTSNIYYRDWTCAHIDLSNYIGKQIQILFVSNDCKHGGYYGYTYIDQICGICAANFDLTMGNTSICGNGAFTVNYTLPSITHVSDGFAPSVKLSLYAIQTIGGNSNKVLVSQISRNSGTSHTFNIDPTNISGLNLGNGLTHFDLLVEADYYFNTRKVGHKEIGNQNTGLNNTLNDDYKIFCNSFYTAINKQFECGPDYMTINYAIPSGGGIMGSIEYKLKATQNGGVGTSIIDIASVTKTSGNTHTFKLNPVTLNLDNTLNGFDYWLEAKYIHNNVVLQIENVGVPLNSTNPYKGLDDEVNNDYLFFCPRYESCK